MKRLASAALAFLLLASPAKAEDLSREDVQQIIREFLVENPDVMMEAMIALKDYQENQTVRENAMLIEKNKDILFNNPNSPSVGEEDAPVTLVEFYDYNCGACKIMFNAIDEYMKEEDGLRVVFKEYPIFGDHSEYAARMALAVHALEPDKYFNFHSGLMTYQGRITKEVVDSVLAKQGLDVEEVRTKGNSDQILKQLAEVAELAKTLRARGTPMLIINDEIVPHALDLDTLRAKVQAIQ